MGIIWQLTKAADTHWIRLVAYAQQPIEIPSHDVRLLRHNQLQHSATLMTNIVCGDFDPSLGLTFSIHKLACRVHSSLVYLQKGVNPITFIPWNFNQVTGMGGWLGLMVGLCRLVVDSSSFRCESCHKPYMSMTGIIDLTISGGAQDLEEALPSGVALFQSVFLPLYILFATWQYSSPDCQQAQGASCLVVGVNLLLFAGIHYLHMCMREAIEMLLTSWTFLVTMKR